MHKIKLTRTGKEDSFWLDIQPKKNYLQEIDPVLENGSPEQIAACLISQFNETDRELKTSFSVLLKTWIGGIKKEDFVSEKVEKVKDSIYEMF